MTLKKVFAPTLRAATLAPAKLDTLEMVSSAEVRVFLQYWSYQMEEICGSSAVVLRSGKLDFCHYFIMFCDINERCT